MIRAHGRRGARAGRARAVALTAVLACVSAATFACAGAPRPRTDTARVVDPTGADLVAAPRVRRVGRNGWVEIEAAVQASDEEAPARARRRAIDRARGAAVEHVAGVSVQSSVVTLDRTTGGDASDLLQALTATQARALIVDEKLLDHATEINVAGGYRVRVKLAARVLSRTPARAGFETEVRLNRGHFSEGDRVELAIRTSEAARLYVLSVSDAGAVVLLPNRHLEDTRVEAGEWLEFPGAELEGRGVALRAALPPDRARSEEALVVVALRGQGRLRGLFPAAGETYRSASPNDTMRLASEFLSPLLGLPAEDWTFDQVVYSISRD